jgi:hypothetical protein
MKKKPSSFVNSPPFNKRITHFEVKQENKSFLKALLLRSSAEQSAELPGINKFEI